MTEQPNPAVVPEPPAPEPRTYLVTGTAQSTLGHEPGETFTALLDPVQERHLIAGGAIEIVNDPAPTEDRPSRGRRSPARKPAAQPGSDPINTTSKE